MRIFSYVCDATGETTDRFCADTSLRTSHAERASLGGRERQLRVEARLTGSAAAGAATAAPRAVTGLVAVGGGIALAPLLLLLLLPLLLLRRHRQRAAPASADSEDDHSGVAYRAYGSEPLWVWHTGQ